MIHHDLNSVLKEMEKSIIYNESKCLEWWQKTKSDTDLVLPSTWLLQLFYDTSSTHSSWKYYLLNYLSLWNSWLGWDDRKLAKTQHSEGEKSGKKNQMRISVKIFEGAIPHWFASGFQLHERSNLVLLFVLKLNIFSLKRFWLEFKPEINQDKVLVRISNFDTVLLRLTYTIGITSLLLTLRRRRRRRSPWDVMNSETWSNYYR